MILHADMDAFYAAVEQRDRPELRGLPVIVGGTGRRGVVSSASYEARRFGVRSAMPAFEARRLCPDGVFLAGDMDRYARESKRIFEIFRRVTPQVEGLSLDEAFLDLAGTERLHGPAREAAQKLRAWVRAETGLVVSIGIAPVKLVAKIASDLAKPDGCLEVPAAGVEAFLAPLPVSRLWGVGPVAEARLLRAGFATLGDLARADGERVEALLGPHGRELQRLARGDDPRKVEPEREAVSISEENTFAGDVDDPAVLAATALSHAEAVARRLRHQGLRARTVWLKLKLAARRRPGARGFDLVTRRTTFGEPTDDGQVLYEAVRRLLDRAALAEPVRLLGVGVTNLVRVESAQGGLFDAPPTDPKRARLNRALDVVTERFGRGSVVRAGAAPVERAGLSLQRKRGERPDQEPADG